MTEEKKDRPICFGERHTFMDGRFVSKVRSVQNHCLRLEPRFDLINYLPGQERSYELDWGHKDSPPEQLQLALAMLADYLQDNDEEALRLHKLFEKEVVAYIGEDPNKDTDDPFADMFGENDLFTLTESTFVEFLSKYGKKEPARKEAKTV